MTKKTLGTIVMVLILLFIDSVKKRRDSIKSLDLDVDEDIIRELNSHKEDQLKINRELNENYKKRILLIKKIDQIQEELN